MVVANRTEFFKKSTGEGDGECMDGEMREDYSLDSVGGKGLKGLPYLRKARKR